MSPGTRWRRCWSRPGYSVVAADLRGYGDTARPEGGDNHVNYSKRAMAADQVAVMRALGHDELRRGRA